MAKFIPGFEFDIFKSCRQKVTCNKIAGQAHSGRGFKPAVGIVSSVIIPVKIHDLDTTYNEHIDNEIYYRHRPNDFLSGPRCLQAKKIIKRLNYPEDRELVYIF